MDYKPTTNQFEKYAHLKKILREAGRVAIAYSGGVDSAFLLRAAWEALEGNVIALTATSSFFPQRETREAIEFCQSLKLKQVFVPVSPQEIENFYKNPKDRCYACKRHLFQKMLEAAAKEGISYLAEGSNLDDEGDYRPGMRAVAELHIQSPLRECGLWKQDIRELSRYLHLPTWSKPSYACLASRFVYGEEITPEKLSMVERAEDFLTDLGFSQLRVRIHGTLARIEVSPSQLGLFQEERLRLLVDQTLKEIGFTYVTVDLKGYRTGSMNETLEGVAQGTPQLC